MRTGRVLIVLGTLIAVLAYGYLLLAAATA
jgi:hypothetical protein